MAQRVYLLTSPEKFQQQRSSGSCNSDSPGATGKRIPVILQKRSDWLLLTGRQPSPQSDDTSEKKTDQSGEHGEPQTVIPSLLVTRQGTIL